MQKTNLLIRSLLLLILSLVMINTNAQTGLNFQGVARTGNNVILASQAITIKLSILQGSSTGTADYVETRRVITNAQGLFTAVIGDTGAISTLGNFASINWKNTPKFLKIEMDAAGGTDFITMGTTQFQYVAYAQFAKTVDAENIVGVVPVTLGGTGVNSLTGLKTSLAIGNVNNTTDLTKPISTATQTALDLKSNTADVTTSLATKVDKLTGKDLSSNDYTSADKSKLAAITGTNTGDQNLNSYATITALALKANASDLTAGLLLKSNITDVTTSLSLKENAVNKSTAVDLGGTSPSDVLYPTQKAVKDYVTANNSSGGISDGGVTTTKLADLAVTDAKLATGISKSKVGLANVNNTTDLLKPVSTATQSALDLKSNTSEVNSSLATKVDKLTGKDLSSNDYISADKSKLAAITGTNTGDQTTITGNAATATKLATPKNINGVAFDGSADITITATADAGTLSGMVALANGGTGSTTAAGARTNLGLVIGADVQAPLTAGTNYIAPNASITGATKTKLTYDAKGLVTVGADATTTDIAPSTNRNYVTDAQSGVISNTSGTNTGDETTSTIKTKLGITTLSGSNTGDQTISLTGDITGSGTGTFTSTIGANKVTNAMLAGSITASKLVGTDITTVGTITSGVWSGTAIANNQLANSALTIGSTSIGLGNTATTLAGLSSVASIGFTGTLSGTASSANALTTGRTIATTGDITYTSTAFDGVSNVTGTATLTNTTVSSGNYGSSTTIPTFTVDTKGRLTAAGSASIIADAGTLTGTTLNSTVTGSSLTSVGTIASLTTGSITNSGKVIVGGSSAASSSAVLEASSTSQGFLPPRMTKAQRNAIASPASGLIIYCTNCGSGEPEFYNGASWRNMIGSAPAPTIGDAYLGGILAYILISGDPGYDANTFHGLIAATSDLGTRIQWYDGYNVVTYATGTAIGTGLANTNAIITNQGGIATRYAAGLARAYNEGGYTDWFLPSQDEMNKLYINRVAIGGFQEMFYYWTSTEYTYSYAWLQRFAAQSGYAAGSQGSYSKYLEYRVRAIRAF